MFNISYKRLFIEDFSGKGKKNELYVIFEKGNFKHLTLKNQNSADGLCDILHLSIVKIFIIVENHYAKINSKL